VFVWPPVYTTVLTAFNREALSLYLTNEEEEKNQNILRLMHSVKVMKIRKLRLIVWYWANSTPPDFEVDVILRLERHMSKEFVEIIIWALSEKTCEDI